MTPHRVRPHDEARVRSLDIILSCNNSNDRTRGLRLSLLFVVQSLVAVALAGCRLPFPRTGNVQFSRTPFRLINKTRHKTSSKHYHSQRVSSFSWVVMKLHESVLTYVEQSPRMTSRVASHGCVCVEKTDVPEDGWRQGERQTWRRTGIFRPPFSKR